jgi:hypothetical protein
MSSLASISGAATGNPNLNIRTQSSQAIKFESCIQIKNKTSAAAKAPCTSLMQSQCNSGFGFLGLSAVSESRRAENVPTSEWYRYGLSSSPMFVTKISLPEM